MPHPTLVAANHCNQSLRIHPLCLRRCRVPQGRARPCTTRICPPGARGSPRKARPRTPRARPARLVPARLVRRRMRPWLCDASRAWRCRALPRRCVGRACVGRSHLCRRLPLTQTPPPPLQEVDPAARNVKKVRSDIGEPATNPVVVEGTKGIKGRDNTISLAQVAPPPLPEIPAPRTHARTHAHVASAHGEVKFLLVVSGPWSLPPPYPL